MRLIMYTGKGGTGKTVTSCSTAIKLADRNYNTLVVSSDPAHTLNDAFRISSNHKNSLNDEVNNLMEIFPHLHALQVDPLNEMNKQYNNILSYIASIFSSRGMDETLSYEFAMMPGMTQLFALLKIEEVMRTKTYDKVVLDMPASGDALRYLYLPKLMGSIRGKLPGLMGAFSGFSKMIQAISGVSVSDNMLQFEQELFDRLTRLASIIKDDNTTSLRLVANPDSFSIENAKRALMSANLYGINVDLVIINKVMPGNALEVEPNRYYEQWTKYQHTKVNEAKANFYPLPLKEVPLHSSELAGIGMLRLNANLIFKDEDPAKIFYRGKPFSILREEPNTLKLAINVPFTQKENFDIRRHGSEVIIKVKSSTGNMVNVIPLPPITFDMKMIEAELNGNMLFITFEKRL